jgi:ssDNA-binding Zn-finger/Zn-ribbon topoisomerase 1
MPLVRTMSDTIPPPKSSRIEPLQPVDGFPPISPPPSCPRHGLTMRKRHGKRGWFLGCREYPSCLYTADITTGIASRPESEKHAGDAPELLPEELRGGEPVEFAFRCAHCGRRNVIRGAIEEK